MDDFGKFFRGFFGVPSQRRREPFYDDLDDEMSRDGDRGFHSFFGNSRSSEDDFDRMFEHFHGDMFRHMESLQKQMEDMMRGFGGVRFPSDFQPPSIEKPPSHNETPRDREDRPRENPNSFRIWFGTPSPFFHHGPEAEGKGQTPRDFMLKDNLPEEDGERSLRPALPAPSVPKQERPRQPVVTFPESSKRRPQIKEDTDLDGKLSDKEVLDLITKRSEAPTPSRPVPSEPRVSSWGTSVSVTRVQRPDGKIEEKRVVRDASGHEESTVKKSMGDQSYTVTTIKGEDGNTETRETFQNMDQKDVGQFEEQWESPFSRQPRHPADSLLTPQQQLPHEVERQDRDLFSKLFGWKAK